MREECRSLDANGYVVVHRDTFPYTSPNDYTIDWALDNVHLWPGFNKACWNRHTQQFQLDQACERRTSENATAFLKFVKTCIFGS